MGEHVEALKQVRECLRLDQEHKQCKTFYTKAKKFTKLYDAIVEGMQNNKYGRHSSASSSSHDDAHSCTLRRFSESLKNLAQAKTIETEVFHYVNSMNQYECEAHAGLGKHKDGIAVSRAC